MKHCRKCGFELLTVESQSNGMCFYCSNKFNIQRRRMLDRKELSTKIKSKELEYSKDEREPIEAKIERIRLRIAKEVEQELEESERELTLKYQKFARKNNWKI